MDTRTQGIHHITAIAGDPQTNLDFYTRVLGMRLVKLTVNFDDPSTYHFYYSDYAGRPGSVLTFFPWEGAPLGRPGPGLATTISFRITEAALDYWTQRLSQFGIGFDGPGRRFDEQVISFLDPDGIDLELVAQPGLTASDDPPFGPVPPEFALQGFHSVTLTLSAYERSAALLTQTFGFKPVRETGSRFRYDTGSGEPGSIVDIVPEPSARIPRGEIAVGTVHHVALRIPDDDRQLVVRKRLTDLGFSVSPVRDRNYFHSIYFTEPGGVNFEVATDGPGFDVDEPLEQLGSDLKLPPWYERDRESIESLLTPIRLSEGGSDPMNDDLGFVHRFVPGSGENAGLTLLMLHGTGGNESDLLQLGQMIAPGATLLSPRGKVLENGMPRFFRRLAEGVFDVEDLKERTSELAGFIDRAVDHYDLNRESLVAVGYSNGANIAASLLLSDPERLAGAVLFRAMVPFEPDGLPALSGKPVLISAGLADPLIPKEGTERLSEILQDAGADVTVEWTAPDHGLVRDDVEAASRWLAERWGSAS